MSRENKGSQRIRSLTSYGEQWRERSQVHERNSSAKSVYKKKGEKRTISWVDISSFKHIECLVNMGTHTYVLLLLRSIFFTF